MAPERLLLLTMLRRTYGIRIEDLRGVDGDLPIRRVPGAPEPVLGLVEQRGRIRTLIDLELLLDELRSEPEPVTIHLAPPHGKLSLRAFARLELGEGSLSEAPTLEPVGGRGGIGALAFREPDGEEIHVLSPARLLDEVQRRSPGF